MRAPKPCAKPGCPTPAKPGTNHCKPHQQTTWKQRGTPKQRGYDHTYQAQRKTWAKRLQHTNTTCWRCKKPIKAGTQFHLGHSDDRTQINGPEHPTCNLSAAGKQKHKHQ